MGESGSRRSTLVSRLPIFRRSNSKRQESLPSSPSSGGVGNGVHSSSPSSTNSSSGSTGKRRSLFRAPSLSFTAKRNSDPPDQPTNLNHASQLPQSTDANGNNPETLATMTLPSTGFTEGGSRPRSRHSFGFGGHKKKITRSQTEEFDKGSSSSTANRNVFINCISGSGGNEGDDSGFLDDYSEGSRSNKRSSRHKKQLLPKSFSAHHRFSRTSDHNRPPEVNLEPPSTTTPAPGTGGLTPGSWPGELLGESSLQSPMVSDDRTTAITPSEFVPITEDSISEVDALPVPSPGSGLDPVPAPVPGLATDTAPAAPETFTVAVSTSQVQAFCQAVESKALLFTLDVYCSDKFIQTSVKEILGLHKFITARVEMDEEQIIPPLCPWMSAAKSIKEEYLRPLCEMCKIVLKTKQWAWNVLSVRGTGLKEKILLEVCEPLCATPLCSEFSHSNNLLCLVLLAIKKKQKNNVSSLLDTETKELFI